MTNAGTPTCKRTNPPPVEPVAPAEERPTIANGFVPSVVGSAAELVTEARQRAGLSQRELARRSGVSRTTVVELESGRRDSSLGTLRSVLAAAGFDLELLLVRRDDHDRELAEALRHLPADDVAELRANLDRFVGGLADGLATSRPLIGDVERSTA